MAKLYFYYSTMNAGKSTALLQSSHNYRERGMRTLVYTAELDRRGLDVPLVWGNRNSEPYFADALRDALDLGATRVVTVLTSAYSSYSSCRQYREDLAAAVAEVGPAADGLVVDKVRPYFSHPGLGTSWARALVAAAE